LMLQENIDAYPQNLQNLRGFRIQRLPLRWWFPEDEGYRLGADWTTRSLGQVSLVRRVLRAPFNTETEAHLSEYLIHRQRGAPLGSTDCVIAVRPDLADEIGLGTGAPER